MKFGLVHMLVALCLCTGVLHTGAENLRSRVLPRCQRVDDVCNKKEDCCEDLNCIGPFTEGGNKTCQIFHCIPEGKQCDNGARSHECCEDLTCVPRVGKKGKTYCAPEPYFPSI